ncbi:MAG: protein kinase, partial [Chloroflexota bacterium]
MSLGKRYELRRLLGQGGMGVVHEAYDQLKDRLVALKQLKALTETAKKKMSFASETEYRLTLAKEFQILASLRHPNIVSVYDYGFNDEGTPYFTMEFLENAPTLLAAGVTRSIEDKVTLLIELLQALAYLHRHNIVHRDVKPENVLVTDGRVKTLDFGLAISRTDDFKLKANAIAGTYAYIAPEVFEGYTPTRASDLWSVGVIAFELFGDKHPFNTKTLNMLIADVLMRDADVASLGLPDDLEIVLERLLMRDPELRYNDAFAVIDALNRALGDADTSDPEHIRESFLQTPKFVGRQEELRQLRVALEATLDEETGSSWLIGGESGVGKSRLIDEIRSLALVKGFTVLTGQGTTNGLPYQLWRNVMRPLVFEADLSLIQKQVLKEIVPDIELLLDEDIPDAPVLEGTAGKQRLMTTIADVLLASEQPLLLLLEDLHWGSDSLDPLTAISEKSPEKSLMLIGTYRNDETPDLPTQFPAMQTLTLERLSRDEMTALSTSILGDFGKKEDVVTLLEQQTEGNCFFIEEVMRELVLTAGRIHNVSSIELPSEIFTVSMDAMLSKRLHKVMDTANYADALILSAIYGREIDQALLQTALPDLPIDEFLYATDNAAVLNVRSDNWSFAHDKLRESILRDLDDTACQTRHRQVAEAIEATYADNDDYDERLLHHWHHADDRDKEFTYLEKTVFTLLNRRPAFHRAIEHLDRSLTHYDETDERYVAMLVHKADALRLQGAFARAEVIARGAISMARQHNAS